VVIGDWGICLFATGVERVVELFIQKAREWKEELSKFRETVKKSDP